MVQTPLAFASLTQNGGTLTQPRPHSTLASTELSALAVPSCIPAATNTVRNVVVGGASAILSRFPKSNQTPMLLLLAVFVSFDTIALPVTVVF